MKKPTIKKNTKGVVEKKTTKKKEMTPKKEEENIKVIRVDSKKLDTFLKSQEKKKKEVQIYKKKKEKDPSFENEEMKKQIRFRNSIVKKMTKEEEGLEKETTNDLFDNLVESMICIRDILEKGPVIAPKNRKDVIMCLIRIYTVEQELKKRKVKKIYKKESPFIKEACKQIKLFYSVLEKTEQP